MWRLFTNVSVSVTLYSCKLCFYLFLFQMKLKQKLENKGTFSLFKVNSLLCKLYWKCAQYINLLQSSSKLYLLGEGYFTWSTEPRVSKAPMQISCALLRASYFCSSIQMQKWCLRMVYCLCIFSERVVWLIRFQGI